MLITPRIAKMEKGGGENQPAPPSVPRCLPLPFYASGVLRRDAILAIAPDILYVATAFKTIAFYLIR